VSRKALSHIELAKKRFRETLNCERIESVARETKFVQRERIITGANVFWALIVTLGAHGTQYISDVLRSLNARHGLSIRYKPFWNRLAKEAFPRFMKSMFAKLCREMTTEVLRSEPCSDASFFSDILVDDGSSFAVADGLRKIFPGRFTKVKPAAVELHAHMSLFSDQMLCVSLAPDKESERKFLPSAESLPARSLSLRDRGYIDLEYFEDLRDRTNGPAYLIVRSNDNINPTIENIYGVPLRIAKKWRGKQLQKLPKSILRRGADLEVSWPRPGNKTLRLRLVVRHSEPKKRNCRKHIRLTKKEKRYIEKNRWIFLLTNVPSDISADAIVRLYRLRWQIELAFKEWKSYANLHAFQSEHPAIVEGFIWASLCAALLKRSLAHWAQLTHGCAISVRIAAQSGPQLISQLIDWLLDTGDDSIFSDLISFLAENAQRTHPRRDNRRPQKALGIEWVTQPVNF
jgi:hypothetical protein